MLNWKEYRTELMGRVGQIAKLAPDTIKGYQALLTAGQKTNHLTPKQRELISLAVAVTVRCDGCIVMHTTEALKHGTTEEEIAEALGVAVSVNAGAALVYSARVIDASTAISE
ncbi:carboxymuconolactone decarboxylase family protein [Ensifer sp. 4252]|uniref:carboxymuconolactone decarboxylase family protein n=1 Tax=Ensifer sp. 4252 TaxID=3373915 RepID=UPI003D1BCF31